MAKKLPPEYKVHTHRDPTLTVWVLLEREGLMERVYTDAWVWYALSPKLRRRYQRERRALETTRIAGYTPPRIQRRKTPDLWLYLTTLRGTNYRLHPDGSIQIWKRNPPQPGIGGGGWGWYQTSSRGIRWLWAISSAVFLRHVRVACAAADATQIAPTAVAAQPDDRQGAAGHYMQLPLFD
jgi:hypothetical protein